MSTLMQVRDAEEARQPFRDVCLESDGRSADRETGAIRRPPLACQAGPVSPAEREALFREFSPLVKRLLNQYGTDSETRRDLVGEIYWRFCRIVDAYDPARGIPFRAYVVRQLSASTHTHARTKWRRSGREIPLDLFEGTRTVEPFLDPTPQWNHDLMAEQVRALIPAAIQTLPRRQRQVLVWRYYEDLGYEEIASILGVQQATVRSLLRHAMNKLRAWVHENGVAFE